MLTVAGLGRTGTLLLILVLLRVVSFFRCFAGMVRILLVLVVLVRGRLDLGAGVEASLRVLGLVSFTFSKIGQ